MDILTLQKNIESLTALEQSLFLHLLKQLAELPPDKQISTKRLNNDIDITYNGTTFVIQIRNITFNISKRDIKLLANGLDTYIHALVAAKLQERHSNDIDLNINVPPAKDTISIANEIDTRAYEQKLNEELAALNEARLNDKPQVRIDVNKTVKDIMLKPCTEYEFLPLWVILNVTNYLVTHGLIRISALRAQIQKLYDMIVEHDDTTDETITHLKLKIKAVFKTILDDSNIPEFNSTLAEVINDEDIIKKIEQLNVDYSEELATEIKQQLINLKQKE